MSAEKAGELPVCEHCPYKRRPQTIQVAILTFALAMWGADNIIAWITVLVPTIEPYKTTWWMNIVVVGTLAAAHLWRAPGLKFGGGNGSR